MRDWAILDWRLRALAICKNLGLWCWVAGIPIKRQIETVVPHLYGRQVKADWRFVTICTQPAELIRTNSPARLSDAVTHFTGLPVTAIWV